MSALHADIPLRKIPCTLSLTERQINALRGPAKKLGITVQDLMRRLIDQWIAEGEKEI